MPFRYRTALRSIAKRLSGGRPETLTFRPPYRGLLNAVALPGRMLYPEFRALPPNHLRCRLGASALQQPSRDETAAREVAYRAWSHRIVLDRMGRNSDTEVLA